MRRTNQPEGLDMWLILTPKTLACCAYMCGPTLKAKLAALRNILCASPGASETGKSVLIPHDLFFSEAQLKNAITWPSVFFTSSKCRRGLLEFARLKVQEDEIEAKRLTGLGKCGTAGDLGTCLSREFDSPAPWSSKETSASGSRRKLLWTTGYQKPFHDEKHLRIAFERQAKGGKLLDSRLAGIVLRDASASPDVEIEPSLEELERAKKEAGCINGCTLEDLQHAFQQMCERRTWPEVAPSDKGRCMAEDLLDAALPQQRINEPFPGWLELNGLKELKGRLGLWLFGSTFLEIGITQISIKNVEGMMHVGLPISNFVNSTGSTRAHWKYLTEEGSSRHIFSFDGPTDAKGSKHCGDKFEVDVVIGLEAIGLSTLEEVRFMGVDLSTFLAKRLRASMKVCLRIPETELELNTVTPDEIKDLFERGHFELMDPKVQQWDSNCPKEGEDCWVDLSKMFLGIDLVNKAQNLYNPVLQSIVFEHVLFHLATWMSFVFLGKLDSILYDLHLPLDFYHCRNPDKENPVCGFTLQHLRGRSSNTLREAAVEHGTVPGWTAFLGARAGAAAEEDGKALHDCAAKKDCGDDIFVAWEHDQLWSATSPAFQVAQQPEQPQFWHLWMEWADRDQSGSVTLKELSYLMAAFDVKYGERIDNLLMLKLTPTLELTGHNDNKFSNVKLSPSTVAQAVPRLASTLDHKILSKLFMPTLTRVPGKYSPEERKILESEGRSPLGSRQRKKGTVLTKLTRRVTKAFTKAKASADEEPDVNEGFGPLPSAELVRPVSMPADLWAGLSIKDLLPSTTQLGHLKHKERDTAKGVVKDVTASMGLDMNLDYILRTFVAGQSNVDFGYVFSSAPMRWGNKVVIAVVNCNTLRIFEAAPIFTDEKSCRSKPVGTACSHLHGSTSTGKTIEGTCQRTGERTACATSWRPVVHDGRPHPLHEQPLEQVFELWMLNLNKSVVKDQGTRKSEIGPYVQGGFAKCAKSPDIHWVRCEALARVCNMGKSLLDFASPEHDPMCGTAPELADVKEGSEIVKPEQSHRAFKELFSLVNVGWSASLADLSSDLWQAVRRFALQDLGDGQCLISPVNHAFVEELGNLGKIDPRYFRFGWKVPQKAGFQWLCLRELENGLPSAVHGLFDAIARQVQRNLLPAVVRKSSQRDGRGWEPSNPLGKSRDSVVVGKDTRKFSITGRVQTETDQYGMDMNPLMFSKPSARLEGETIDELGWTVLPGQSIKKRTVKAQASQGSTSGLGKKFMAARTDLWNQVRTSTITSKLPFEFSIAKGFDELILLETPATLPKCKCLLPVLAKEGTPCGTGCMCWNSCSTECSGFKLDPVKHVRLPGCKLNRMRSSLTSSSRYHSLCIGLPRDSFQAIGQPSSDNLSNLVNDTRSAFSLFFPEDDAVDAGFHFLD